MLPKLLAGHRLRYDVNPRRLDRRDCVILHWTGIHGRPAPGLHVVSFDVITWSKPSAALCSLQLPLKRQRSKRHAFIHRGLCRILKNIPRCLPHTSLELELTAVLALLPTFGKLRLHVKFTCTMQHLKAHTRALTLLHRLAAAAACQHQQWAVNSVSAVQVVVLQLPGHGHCQQQIQQRLYSSMSALLDLQQHSHATRGLMTQASSHTLHATQQPWTQQQQQLLLPARPGHHQLQQLRSYSDDAARRRLQAAQQRRERERELQERRAAAAPAVPADQQQQHQLQQDRAAADAPPPATGSAYALTPLEVHPSEAQVCGIDAWHNAQLTRQLRRRSPGHCATLYYWCNCCRQRVGYAFALRLWRLRASSCCCCCRYRRLWAMKRLWSRGRLSGER
jgi:hypothetical protein